MQLIHSEKRHLSDLFSIICICDNIELWQSRCQYADDALKFRAIRSWGGCSPKEILWLMMCSTFTVTKSPSNGYEDKLTVTTKI